MTYLFTSPDGGEDIAVTINLPEAAALDNYSERMARVKAALIDKLGNKGKVVFFMWNLEGVY